MYEPVVGADRLLRWAPALVLATILGVFLIAKARYDPDPVGHYRYDGTVYYEVARHVAEGRGLQTSLSLYHQGRRVLPAPSTLYPLWPLALGGAGAVIGLDRAATLVPEILFFVDLLLLYVLANRVAGHRARVFAIRGRPILDVGHVAVLLLGTNRIFFWFTSLPWAEGLALGLALASLLALDRAARDPIRWGIAAGTLAGLAFLARSQLLALVPAVAGSLVLVGLSRPRYLGAAAAALLASALAVLPWILFLLSFATSFDPRMLVDIVAYRETPALLPYTWLVEYGSISERLTDFAEGIGISLQPFHPNSYVRSFGTAAYLVPWAAVVGLWHWRGRGRRSTVRFDPSSLLWIGTGLAAIGCLLPTHVMRTVWPFDWWFHWRHGLPLIFAIALALGTLLSRGRISRATALVLVAASVWMNTSTALPASLRLSYELPLRAGPRKVERALIDWLNRIDPAPVVLSTMARELSVWTRANFHFIRCDDPAEQTRRYFQHLDLDYVIAYPGEGSRCSYLEELQGNLEAVKVFRQPPHRIVVFRWRRPAPPG